ncbi:MAG: STAS domain-containing protein [Paracoccaceae bacterium]
MKLTSTNQAGRRIVTVDEARIDSAVALSFKDQMRKETTEGPDVVILDLCNVNFVDSSGLGAIVAALKAMGPGRTLALAGLSPTVDKVFRLTRMNSVFSIYPTLDDALEGSDA